MQGQEAEVGAGMFVLERVLMWLVGARKMEFQKTVSNATIQISSMETLAGLLAIILGRQTFFPIHEQKTHVPSMQLPGFSHSTRKASDKTQRQ